ncbi:DUF447 domain-containing protein [Methanoregula sp.]|uniref:DUF447 domain-containing protein n=1 Tax=Methanoregula sp. TaxID=2052170 RepID=UPI002BA4BAD9|nr:DUF447 domain-containing protein [Methanoregula sp.]HVP95845.1 DUF447 domain-containing protein [Methanoregula sp.]
MGLLKTGINEVIATTAFNAAPIGVHVRDGTVSMILFSGTHTAENILRDGWVVANLVHDPLLYVKTAFEDLPRDAFVEEPVAGKTMCRLAEAEAWVAYTAQVEKNAAGTLRVVLTQEKEIIETVAVHPVNRGFNNLVDATVHATRYRENRDPELKKLLEYHTGIVRKCGGKKELAALDLLQQYIGDG